MIAIDYEKQVERIEGEASRSLQVLAQGGDTHETIGYLISSMARIYVLIHDCELLPSYQAEIVLELIEEVYKDRGRALRATNPETFLYMPNPDALGLREKEYGRE